MRIVINTSKLRFGGALQVALSFIYECKRHTEHEYHVFVGQGVGRSLRKEEFPANFHFYDFDFGVLNVFKLRRISSQLSQLEKQIEPDCVITTSGPSYWHSKSPHLMGYNLGMYIYNDSPYFKTISWYRNLRYFIKRKIHFWFFKRDATALIVQTEDVNRRVRKALKKKYVYTISNTYNNFFSEPVFYDLAIPPRHDGEIRFLTLTSYYPHKNIEIIPGLIEELDKRGHSNVRFILTLPPSVFKNIFRNYDTSRIINVGTVKPEECPTLYNESDYMFLPSLAECFSASYPEAMVMKKPIITTGLSFAKSICGDAAMYYEPMDAKSAAEIIDSLIKNIPLQKALIKNGLERLKKFDNADERARKILELCKMMTNSELTVND
jgi:glycosyltransferase involved in cell wall biosynthesis